MAFVCCTILPHRYLVALLSFLGMLISVGYRTCFALVVTHIAVVNVSNEDTAVSGSAGTNCTTTGTSRDRTVDWSGTTVHLFSTAFFVGQFVSSVPSGAMVSRVSAKRVFGFSILATSILQILLPIASEVVWLVFIIRAVQGIVEAMSVPAMNAVISAWAPKHAKARLINIAYAGVYLSPALASYTGGLAICMVSWDSILYIYGAVGAVWSILWLLVIFPSPSTHPRVSDEEQSLIAGQNGANRAPANSGPIPWKSFFTSMPVWAIWIGAFCRNFIFAILITEVQQYYKDVYSLPTFTIGWLFATPHVFMAVSMVTGSCIFDALAKRDVISMTNIRKLAQSLGFGIQGACFLAIAFIDNYIHVFILFCVAVAFSGLAISGFQTNPLDLAPQYAGPLTGISRTGMLGSVISTLLASQLPGKTHSYESWKQMFIIAGSLHLAGVIFYVIFASGNLQPWAQSEAERDIPDPKAPTIQGSQGSSYDYGSCSAQQAGMGTGYGACANGDGDASPDKQTESPNSKRRVMTSYPGWPSSHLPSPLPTPLARGLYSVIESEEEGEARKASTQEMDVDACSVGGASSDGGAGGSQHGLSKEKKTKTKASPKVAKGKQSKTGSSPKATSTDILPSTMNFSSSPSIY